MVQSSLSLTTTLITHTGSASYQCLKCHISPFAASRKLWSTIQTAWPKISSQKLHTASCSHWVYISCCTYTAKLTGNGTTVKPDVLFSKYGDFNFSYSSLKLCNHTLGFYAFLIPSTIFFCHRNLQEAHPWVNMCCLRYRSWKSVHTFLL